MVREMSLEIGGTFLQIFGGNPEVEKHIYIILAKPLPLSKFNYNDSIRYSDNMVVPFNCMIATKGKVQIVPSINDCAGHKKLGNILHGSLSNFI